MWFMSNAMAKPDNAGAGATDYMHLFGLVALGYMWAKIAKAAIEKKARTATEPRMDAKLVTGRSSWSGMMPETGARLAAHLGRRRRRDGAARGGVLRPPCDAERRAAARSVDESAGYFGAT